MLTGTTTDGRRFWTTLELAGILGELYDKAKAENDGKVHIREIEDGHIGDTIELY